MADTLVLSTEHCTLKPLTAQSAPEFHALWTRPEVRRYLWDDEVIPPSMTQDIVARAAVHLDLGEYGLWGAHPRGESTLAGFGGFWPFHEPPRIELLFGLAPEYWGRGLATEMGNALIGFARASWDMDSILASTDRPNQASIAVLDRLGFRMTGESGDTCYFERPP